MKDGLYIDNLESGGRSVKEAFDLYLKARTRLKHGGFEMDKWKSNSSELTKLMEIPGRIKSEMINGEETDDVTYAVEALGDSQRSSDKVFGIKWNRNEDLLKFDLEEIVKKLMNWW